MSTPTATFDAGGRIGNSCGAPLTWPQCRRSHHLSVLLILLLAPWAIAGPRIVWQGVQTALRPAATCGTEMHILDGAACVARGEPLYPPIDGLPLAYHLYNPLTYLPAGLVGRWQGLDLDALLIAGRIVSLASMVGILALVAWYVRRVTASAWITALAPAMVLYFHSSALSDFFRNRPETPAVLLSLAGWMTAQFRPRGWTVLSALAFVAAMAFKPTFVAAPLAVGLQLVCERQFCALGRIVAMSLVLGLAVVCASYTLLGHGYFEHTVWAMMASPMHVFDRSVQFYWILAKMHWGWLLPATICSAGWLWQRSAAAPLLIYLLSCLAVTTVAHGKVGSDLNYHCELSLLLVLTTLIAIGRMLGEHSRFVVVPLLCLIAGTWSAIVNFGPFWNGISPDRITPLPYLAPSSPPLLTAEQYIDRYSPYRGRAFIQENELSVRVGQPQVYDWFGLTLLFSSNHISFENTIARAVREQRYDVIVLDPTLKDEWSERLRNVAKSSGYRLTWQDVRVEEYTRNDVGALGWKPEA